jgi:hypothetical protein
VMERAGLFNKIFYWLWYQDVANVRHLIGVMNTGW